MRQPLSRNATRTITPDRTGAVINTEETSNTEEKPAHSMVIYRVGLFFRASAWHAMCEAGHFTPAVARGAVAGGG
jgi:hypothetical protein